MNIKPLADRLIIEPIEGAKQIGLIHIPDNAQEKTQRAKVVAIGKGKYDKGKLIPSICKVGDTILYARYAGTEIEINRQKVFIIRESDILCVIEKENESGN